MMSDDELSEALEQLTPMCVGDKVGYRPAWQGWHRMLLAKVVDRLDNPETIN